MAALSPRVSGILDEEEGDFAQGLNTYIASVTRSQVPHLTHEPEGRASPPLEKAPFAWRMHQPEQRKYQLFPRDTQPTPSPTLARPLDAEYGLAVTMRQPTGQGQQQIVEKATEKSSLGSGLKLRLKEHGLIRRRKISVPEMGPMTTVQEMAMDSPTIPGYVASRPSLHDRSVSAPGSGSGSGSGHGQYTNKPSPLAVEKADLTKALPATKTLTPLVIPRYGSPRTMSRLRPVEPALRSARPLGSPKMAIPFPVPVPVPSPAPKSPPQMALPALPTKPAPSLSTPKESSPKPGEMTSGKVEDATTPRAEASSASSYSSSSSARSDSSSLGHRKTQSDTGSIMERGRPRKRSELSRGKLGRVDSVRDTTEERRAFEQLPKGWKAGDAVGLLSWDEATALQRQALQQAARFEVLRKEDVNNLSQELRQLDERTEYLRRTYSSLRAGRRNLQVRICAYLRSPRTAKFQADSMLKQEEALAELDASIDDWANKLDKAQNRRTRVRQKLLEHVAAAALMPGLGVVMSPVGVGVGRGVGPADNGLQHPMATGASDVSTPPRSPAKSVSSQHAIMSSPSPSPSPSPLPSPSPADRAGALDVPSIVFEPAGPAVPPKDRSGPSSAPTRGPPRAETIHIYAEHDVYALLADVEREITKMGRGATDHACDEADEDEDDDDSALKHVYRTRSDDVLAQGNVPSPDQKLTGRKRNNSESDGSVTSAGEASSSSSPSPYNASSTSLSSTSSSAHADMFLTSAVFRPEKSVLAN